MATSIEARKSLREQGKKGTPSAVKAEKRRLESLESSDFLGDTRITEPGLTAQDAQRAAAFQDLGVRAQKGQFATIQEEIAERQRIDALFPASQQAVAFQQQSLSPTGQPFPVAQGRELVQQPQLSAPTQAQISASTGPTQFSTGDPVLDDFLNNTYLPMIELELSGDPTAFLNSEVFKNISERVGATFGPIFEAAKGQIEQDFGLAQESLGLTREQQIADVARTRKDIDTSRGRIGEDVAEIRQREARNFQTAVQESAAAFASAGRAFGGGRIRAERELTKKSAEKIRDVERQSGRQLQDLTQQESRIGEQLGFAERGLGLQERQLDIGRGRELQELTGERTLQEAQERARLRQLGADILRNPEFFPRSLT